MLMRLSARHSPLVLAWLTAACSSDAGLVPVSGGAGGNAAGATSSGGQAPAIGGGGASSAGAGGSSAGSSGGSALGGLSGAGESSAGESSAGESSAGESSAGAGGARAGAAGGPSLLEVAQSLAGLRLEDPCGDPPTDNHVCKHVGSKADADAFADAKVATIGGTPGSSYRVKLHVRGATEGTHTQGGQSAEPKNYVVGGAPFARGTNEANYEYWRIAVDHPAQFYYLNSFDALALAHVIHALDFEISIPVAAGAQVRLEMRDENGHEISNDSALHPDGVAAAPQSGQFIQLDVTGVEAAAP